MKKKWIAITSAVCMAGLLAVVPNTFASSGPDVIDMHNGKKPVKHFAHKKHAESFLKGKGSSAKHKFTDDYTCAGCHHKSHKGETPKKCISCKKDKKKYKKQMHTNCKDGCHKKVGKSSSGKKLTKCKTCHPKK